MTDSLVAPSTFGITLPRITPEQAARRAEVRTIAAAWLRHTGTARADDARVVMAFADYLAGRIGDGDAAAGNINDADLARFLTTI